MSRYVHTLSAGKRIVGVKSILPVEMPTRRDQGAGAEKFRRRNAGKVTTNYRFAGIPIVESLGGLGRWADPVAIPLADLPDMFDATTHKRVAHQSSGPSSDGRTEWRPGDGFRKQPFDWSDWGVIESEDCGLIDIDTPAPVKGAGLPARIQLHDGGNTQNPRMLPRTMGDRLPMVSVMVEYPLSTWGYFTHPAFGESHQPNLAYQVMLAAFEWVQDHGAEFGIDTSRITLDGGSAGAAAGTLLMPQGGTLFHRVVAHSGSGVGRRSTRDVVAGRGQAFWERLVKDIPAYYDSSRTIAEIAAADDVATALRLGPSPDQIIAWGNRRNVYAFPAEGGFTLSSAPDTNIWPVCDGVIIQDATAVAQVLNGRWPTSVQYMATYAGNEAGLIDNARDVEDASCFLATLGITSAEDKTAAIALLNEPGDRWQRRAYGMLYSYGAERLCREHSLRGGSAYLVEFSYDSIGNGRDRPSHTNQQAYFLNKPQWQDAMGADPSTLLLYEASIRCGTFASQSLVNFAANGDPNDTFKSPYSLDLYDAADMAEFREWREFGGEDRWTNVFANSSISDTTAEMVPVQNVERAFYDFVDARFQPF